MDMSDAAVKALAQSIYRDSIVRLKLLSDDSEWCSPEQHRQARLAIEAARSFEEAWTATLRPAPIGESR